MIKKIIAGIFLLSSGVIFSQESNSSPYSYYGLGDRKFKGTVENISMGGVGILRDSIHVNLQNPSGYAALKFTTFTVGANTSATTLKTDEASEKANRTTFNYIAIGIPVNNKFGVGFGLMPLTSVGYKLDNSSVDGDGLERYRRFNGKGGLNRVYGAASYAITPKLSVGAEIQYNFGNIETKSIIAVSDVQYPTRESNDAHYGGASFNLGATYQTRFESGTTWYAAATFTPSTTLNSSVTRNIAVVSYANSGAETIMDALDESSFDEKVKLPSAYSIGTGFGVERKWFVGAQYTAQESNELGNRFDNVSDASFQSSYRMSLGGYFIPKYNSFTSYLSRITYRAGVRYENTGLVLNGEDITDLGVSFGLGLPLGSGIGGSNLNIGFEYGKRGTTNAGLIQENYFNLHVGLSFNEKWFVKRKFN